VNLQQGMSQRRLGGYELKENGIPMYMCRVYVPNDRELKIYYCHICIKFLMLDTQATRRQLLQSKPILLARHEKGGC
jgi:uncharacterized protein YlaI